ncbi:MAG: 5'/3'-nucleotidase SurE [Dehalococcoidia bacterium]
MRILITNDDGIYARGMWELANILKQIGEVVILAPDRGIPGQGAKVTIEGWIKIRSISPRLNGMDEMRCYSAEGTPSDCVITALSAICNRNIDLVVSGINQGANTGEDILISGTVGAALQGYLQDVPSLAISVDAAERFNYDAAAEVVLALAKFMKAKMLSTKFLFNINVPNLPLNQIKDVAVTRLGRVTRCEAVECGTSGESQYYSVVSSDMVPGTEKDTDAWALTNNMISITPLALDGKLMITTEPPPFNLNWLVQAIRKELHVGAHITG